MMDEVTGSLVSFRNGTKLQVFELSSHPGLQRNNAVAWSEYEHDLEGSDSTLR